MKVRADHRPSIKGGHHVRYSQALPAHSPGQSQCAMAMPEMAVTVTVTEVAVAVTEVAVAMGGRRCRTEDTETGQELPRPARLHRVRGPCRAQGLLLRTAKLRCSPIQGSGHRAQQEDCRPERDEHASGGEIDCRERDGQQEARAEDRDPGVRRAERTAPGAKACPRRGDEELRPRRWHARRVLDGSLPAPGAVLSARRTPGSRSSARASCCPSLSRQSISQGAVLAAATRSFVLAAGMLVAFWTAVFLLGAMP
jgi:hypothetical protein